MCTWPAVTYFISTTQHFFQRRTHKGLSWRCTITKISDCHWHGALETSLRVHLITSVHVTAPMCHAQGKILPSHSSAKKLYRPSCLSHCPAVLESYFQFHVPSLMLFVPDSCAASSMRFACLCLFACLCVTPSMLCTPLSTVSTLLGAI